MRNKLLKEIEMCLISCGIDTDLIKSKLVIILNKYEMTDRCTDVAVITNEDDIAKYSRLFLINKRVSGRTERTLKHYKGEFSKG